MGERIDRGLVLSALSMAVGRRNPAAGLIHHSDRGSQYASYDYQAALGQHKMCCSMSRKGDCWDNAVVESFFSTLKTERVHRRLYRSRADAKRDIFEYIEVFYNRVRLHSTLGYLSPAQFESRTLARSCLTKYPYNRVQATEANGGDSTISQRLSLLSDLSDYRGRQHTLPIEAGKS